MRGGRDTAWSTFVDVDSGRSKSSASRRSAASGHRRAATRDSECEHSAPSTSALHRDSRGLSACFAGPRPGSARAQVRATGVPQRRGSGTAALRSLFARNPHGVAGSGLGHIKNAMCIARGRRHRNFLPCVPVMGIRASTPRNARRQAFPARALDNLRCSAARRTLHAARCSWLKWPITASCGHCLSSRPSCLA